MKKIIPFLTVLCLLATSAAFAQSSAGAAEELLKVMKVRENVERMFDQMKAMQDQYMQGEDLSPELIEMREKMMQYMKDAMSWKNVKDDYVRVYTDIFTEAELNQLVNFYKTPIGQKLVERQPEIMQKSMEIGQKRYQEIFPKLLEMMQGDLAPTFEE